MQMVTSYLHQRLQGVCKQDYATTTKKYRWICVQNCPEVKLEPSNNCIDDDIDLLPRLFFLRINIVGVRNTRRETIGGATAIFDRITRIFRD